MNLDFQSRPNHIVGNVAIAGIASGVIVGLVISIFQIIQSGGYFAILENIKNTFETIATLIFFSSIVGLILVAPTLALLSRFNLGGPSSVCIICLICCLCLLNATILVMLIFQILAVIGTSIFCKYAY
jgi:uncharacterized membrane protein (DUF485 family)